MRGLSLRHDAKGFSLLAYYDCHRPKPQHNVYIEVTYDLRHSLIFCLNSTVASQDAKVLFWQVLYTQEVDKFDDKRV